MKQLNPAARTYVVAVILVGATVLCVRAPHMSFARPWLFSTLFVLSCASATMKIALPLATNVSTMSVSYAIDFASLLLLGPDLTMLVAAGSALSQCALNNRERPPLHRTLFSMATLVVTVAAAGFAFDALAAPAADAITATARPLVGAATVYFLVNSGLIAAAIALASRQPIAATWQTNFLWSGPSYFVGAGAAALAVWTMTHVGVWLAPLTFAPIYLTYRTYRLYLGRLEAQRHVQETSDLHLATIEALAAAIDAKDQMSRVHIRRVQAYAAGLAEALALPPSEIQAVRTAALLHDIGKLAIPAHILSKPGPLTPEEFAKVRIHPQIGAEIIASVPFPYPVAPIILSHHEKWDGTGYPHGLQGEAIPLGARIISLVDYFDVVTSDRPYRAAQTRERAVALLQLEAGKSLDPALVDLFIGKLPAFAARFEEGARARDARVQPGGDPRSEPTAFENIALAHQELYALYEIAQTLGTSLGVSDTMDLISSKLAPLIPWTGCALLLQQDDGAGLGYRYARGTDAPRLIGARIGIGEGLSGWVARYRATLVNANPRIEFEAAGLVPDIASRSAIVCPLASGSRFIGALVLFHTDAERYTDDHRRLLVRVAEQAAAVLNNSIVFEQTQEDSLTDPLTGLPNRRSLMTRLSTEVSRAERLERELAVIVLDVDRFKQINDSYGHVVGDEVLREIARVLVDSLRPYDLCVRFAGDEFVIVLGECTIEAAEQKRVELQQRIEEVGISADAMRVRMSVSAGAAVYPHDGRTPDALLASADRRMYSDKAGRRQPGSSNMHEWDGSQDAAASPSAPRLNRPS